MPDTEPDEGRIVVDAVSAMGPWRLRKHVNARHIPVGDYRTEHDGKVYDIAELSMRKCYKDDRPVTEAFHDHCHRTYPERYDHVHE